MTGVLERLSLALEETDAGNDLLSDAADEIRRLRFELNRAEHEKGLAIAHDRQPYPSAESYKKACSDLEEQRQRADKAESSLSESESLADYMTESLATLKKQNQELTQLIERVREFVHGIDAKDLPRDSIVRQALAALVSSEPE